MNLEYDYETPFEYVLHKQMVRNVLAALSSLTEVDRRTLKAYYGIGCEPMSYTEIGEQWPKLMEGLLPPCHSNRCPKKYSYIVLKSYMVREHCFKCHQRKRLRPLSHTAIEKRLATSKKRLLKILHKADYYK